MSSMIGRTDCIFHAPPSDSLPDVILRLCKRYWPEGVFEDGDEDGYYPLNEQAVWEGATSGEFFVYRDRSVAETWEEEGPTPANWNQMFHFLIRHRGSAGERYAEVTVVVDEVTPAVQRFLDDLEATLLDTEVAAHSLPEAA